MKHIIINKEQSDKIRGHYGLYSAIEPVLLPDGMYFLPEKCLDDPDLADARKILSGIQKLSITQELQEVSKVSIVEKDKYYIVPERGVGKCTETQTLSKDKTIDESKWILNEKGAEIIEVEPILKK
jgi:hypothetical protein